MGYIQTDVEPEQIVYAMNEDGPFKLHRNGTLEGWGGCRRHPRPGRGPGGVVTKSEIMDILSAITTA